MAFPRAVLLSILAAAVLAVRGPAAAVEPASALDRYLSAREAMGQFSGAVLVARGDEVLFRKGYGYADVERRLPYTPGTRHQAASIAKMFTAVAALQLSGAGRLSMDDSVCVHLDMCPEQWRPVRIEDLIRHRSGIPDYEAELELGSPEYMKFMRSSEATARILERARAEPLEFEPGSRFQYSNTGYVVLARVIERAAGDPFERYVVEQLLEPAGMEDSGVLGTGDPVPGMAVGYTHADLAWSAAVEGKALTAGHLKPVESLPLTPPAGDAWLYTTVDDLFRWSRVMDGQGFLAQGVIDRVFAADDGFYGYGWFLGEAYDRARTRHNGQLPGYLSNFIRFPEEDLTIVLFSNLDRAPLSHISRDVTCIVLGEPYDMPVRGKAVELEPPQVERLLGSYLMEGGARIEVRKSDEHPTVKLAGRYRTELIPLSPDRFYFPLGDGQVIFDLPDRGQARGLNLRYSGQDHPATRVRTDGSVEDSE